MEEKFFGKKKFVLMVGVLMVVLLCVGVYALNTQASGYSLPKGDKYMRGRWVTSTVVGKVFFIPTRTVSEWSAFLAHKPSGITTCTPAYGTWTDKVYEDCDADTPACGETTTGRKSWERTS